MIGLLSLCLYAIAGFFLSLALKPKNALELFVSFFVTMAGCIIVSGYCLSEAKAIDDLTKWLICSVAAFVISGMVAAIARGYRRLPELMSFARLSQITAQCRASFRAQPLCSILASALIVAFFVVQGMQLAVALSFAPTHHDSNAYILPRMAHYIQQGSLDYFEILAADHTGQRPRATITELAQTVHPKNATILHIYAYLAGGRNDNIINLVAWLSSVLATLGIFGITKLLWKSTLPALMTACVFGLLTNNLMLAVTPQSDMPITGLVAAAVFYMFSFFRFQEYRCLILSALAISIAIGIKASVLLLIPSLFLLVAVGLAGIWRKRGKNAFVRCAGVYLVAVVLGVLLFAVPAGYWDNWSRYGHFMGPAEWRSEHALEDIPLGQRLELGTANAARYAIHFVNLDGLPATSFFHNLQTSLRSPLIHAFEFVGIDPFSKIQVRQPFHADTFLAPHEDYSYAGPAMLFFILPGVLVVLWRRTNVLAMTLIGAGLLYFAAQSYSSLYDPWRGRSFANLAVFWGPAVGCLFVRPKPHRARRFARAARWLLVPCTAVAIFACLNSAFFRHTTPLSAFHHRGNRLEQICRSNDSYLGRLRRFDQEVPANATVLVCRANRQYHYPLYGEGLSRKIIFAGEPHSPDEFDYKVFCASYERPRAGDIPLDDDISPSFDGRWFLRKFVAGQPVAMLQNVAWRPETLDGLSLATLHDFNMQGFGRLEGPFPQANVLRPARWMLNESAEFRVTREAADTDKRILRLRMRSYVPHQSMRVLFNGRLLATIRPTPDWSRWQSVPLKLAVGENTIRIEASEFDRPPNDGRRLFVLFDEIALSH